ncbi:MAG: lipid-A-disaccharide synthase [Parvibaculaceae bacterium]|nr:lipid-A-disaccharide synthase [Parvibaculaceae bacterium]
MTVPVPHIMLVAGETSGDALGAALMAALKEMTGGAVRFSGVGGEKMIAQGLVSIFPMTDIAVMGPREVIPRLPLILRRMRETANHAVETRPDVMVIIDSPDFTHTVAKRVAKRAPQIPIANYVSPSVWAWRRGRAKAMAKYLKRVLALLPFEPDFFKAQAGLDCIYVGHPAIERIPTPESGVAFRHAHGIPTDAPVLALLPGSRLNEVKRLIGIFGEVASALHASMPDLRFVLPTVPHVHALVEAEAARWSVSVEIVSDEMEKRGAFAASTAALAASGTVSLELGLAGVPMVIGYRIDGIAGSLVGRMLKVPSVVLVNLILDRPSVKEFLQYLCTVENLAAALKPLLGPTPERARALADLEDLRRIMGVGGEAPSRRAAKAVLEMLPGKLKPAG